MKKILSLILGAALVASMAVSTSAAIEGANSKTVKATIKAAAETPKLDGVIGEYEYAKIDTPAADMLYGGTGVEAAMQKLPFELYACYDKDYVYVAVKTLHEKHKNENDKDMTTIWNSDGIQIATAKATPASATDRVEIGYALSSTSGKVLYNTWSDGPKTGYKAQESDAAIKIGADAHIYEVRIPAKAFGDTALEKGDTMRLTVLLNSLSNGTRGWVEWGQGTSSTKDANNHPVITLGDAIELPKKAAPATADATSVAILALAASLAAGYVVAKKH